MTVRQVTTKDFITSISFDAKNMRSKWSKNHVGKSDEGQSVRNEHHSKNGFEIIGGVCDGSDRDVAT